MIYRIRDWDKNFENDRSRKVERCSYLVSPNKQHGVGFTYIMAEQDGASIVEGVILGPQSTERARHELR